MHTPLRPEQLCHRCDPGAFAFETTSDLDDLTGALGQSRAIDAIRFGIGIRREGYNLYAMGGAGSGKHSILRAFLEEQVGDQPQGRTVPPDWCYVHNFDEGYKPRVLRLPSGQARRFSTAMKRLVEDLRAGIPAAFETDEYRARARELEAEFSERQENAFEGLRERARDKGIRVTLTSDGWTLEPQSQEGEVVEDEAFQKLPEAQQRRLSGLLDRFKKQLVKVLDRLPRWRREVRQKIRDLNARVVRAALRGLIEDLKKEFAGLDSVRLYLTRIQEDVVENADDFRPSKGDEEATPLGIPVPQPEAVEELLERYRVNVLIDHSESHGAPIIYEDNPTHDNLVGRIEHLVDMGALLTDLTLIKPGSLHRANGGYLIVDAAKLLEQPLAWEGLKRALRSRQIKIESLEGLTSAITTITLVPEPIPLDLKVILVGERQLFNALCELDSDFSELFKVVVDFQQDMDRTPEGVDLYARLIATLVRREGLRPFERGAVARLIEHSSRLAEDSQKLWLQMGTMVDLLVEADHCAGLADRSRVLAQDVQRAVEGQQARADQIRQRLQEEILRGTLLIDTSGLQVGQVNGLSVCQQGGYSFGHPTRITARVRLGEGTVIDIEREVELGGPLHSKGVLILSGFLAGRYAPDRPLSLLASLVFEQSYANVEGDSASSAELYALLSALAEVPIRQCMAVTGSVNQRGQIQAIGGVNEKIEGFFEVCRAGGLKGDQGVLIPASNLPHLMLRQDVVQAVAAGEFQVYAVETIDQGMEILTGIPSGQPDSRGRFPSGSLNGRVERRLRLFAERARAFRRPKR